MVIMNKLPLRRRAQIIGMMVEGVSIRAITRMTGVSKNTVAKLLADAGMPVLDYQDRALRNLALQADSGRRNLEFRLSNRRTYQRKSAANLVMATLDLDGDRCRYQLILRWYVGTRDGDAAFAFMTDLAIRLANRVQLTTDGHHAYLSAR